MTITFWLTVAVLIALALAFILYPLLFHKSVRRAATDQRNQNLMAYRSRLDELDGELAAGVIDQQAYDQLKDELEGSMLDDVGEAPAAVPVADRRRTSAVAVVLASVVLVPVAAILLYREWGAMEQLEQYRTMMAMAAEQGDRVAQMERLTGELRERLEADPGNPDGWAMLGRSYMRIERYQDAAWAFERLAQQVTDDQARAVAWGLSAQALFFDSQGEMTSAVSRAIESAQALNPDEVNALGLLGINAYSQNRFDDAIRHWERIVTVAPDHPQLASIQEGIDQAYQQLGRDNPARSAVPASDGAGVTVRIELAEEFAAEVPADTALFVFAREPGESRAIPVAVARLRAADLPVELRLDDRYAMNQTARISDTSEVLVTARLSVSGNAMPQPGDWQGEVDQPLAVVEGERSPVTLVIDTRLH